MTMEKSDIPKKTTLILSSTVLFCVILIGILYGLSAEHISYSQNFIRSFSDDKIKQTKVMVLGSDSHYIAGITANHIYLGNTKDPLNLLVTSTLLTDTQRVRITKENKDNEKLAEAYIQVDSPFFYIKDGSIPRLFRGGLNKWHAYPYMDHTPPFKQAVPISSRSFVALATIGAPEGNELKNILCKISLDSPFIQWSPELLETKTEDYYTTNGILRYNSESNELVYTYFYCNQYLILDTSLQVVYKGQTIDAVSHAKTKRVRVSKYIYALASPASIVNRNSYVAGKWLYVHSNLMGRKESRRAFELASAIDVYDLAAKEYKYSFYVPDFHGKKMESFRIVNNHLIALFGPYLVRYDMERSK